MCHCYIRNLRGIPGEYMVWSLGATAKCAADGGAFCFRQCVPLLYHTRGCIHADS